MHTIYQRILFVITQMCYMQLTVLVWNRHHGTIR